MLTDIEYAKAKETFDYMHSIFKSTDDPVFSESHEHWEDPKYLTHQLESGHLTGGPKVFALACRYRLNLAKVPNRIAYCKTEEGDSHLVCEAEGWILDSRQPRIRSWGELPYEWIKISGYHVGEPWHEIVV